MLTSWPRDIAMARIIWSSSDIVRSYNGKKRKKKKKQMSVAGNSQLAVWIKNCSVFGGNSLLSQHHREVAVGVWAGTLWPAPWCLCSGEPPWRVLLRSPCQSAKTFDERKRRKKAQTAVIREKQPKMLATENEDSFSHFVHFQDSPTK